MPHYLQAYEKEQPGMIAVHQKEISVQQYHCCRNIPSPVIEEFINEIVKDNPKSVLEAGVGDGRVFYPLVERAHHTVRLYGIDISEPMLAALQKTVDGRTNVTLYHADLRARNDINLRPHSIDIAYTFATLHIISQGWQDVLDNLETLVTKKGKIILAEEINPVFHGSENLFEDDDYRLTELAKGFPETAERVSEVCRFFRRYHQLRKMHHYPFRRTDGQVLHGDQSPAERYLRNKGFSQRTHTSEGLRWKKQHSWEEILTAIHEGTVTTLGSDLPRTIRSSICHTLQKEYNERGPWGVPAEIQLHIFQR